MGVGMVALRREREQVRVNPAVKSERLNARLTPQAKELVQEAAALSGRSLTDFVAEAAREKALATIRDHRVWTLNAEQSLAFAQAILHPDPPEPTAAQRAFAADYWRAVAEMPAAAPASAETTEPTIAASTVSESGPA